MPTRDNGYTPMESLPLEERLAMDNQWQAHWYRHVGTLATGKTVLDAGAGTGYGLPILRAAGVAAARGFDIVDISDDVCQGTIEDYDAMSWDWVLAVDVIEHVEDDTGFVRDLLRVAREAVFISTPNWNVSGAANKYHVREYTPTELRALIASFGFVTPWTDHEIWVSNHELVITTRLQFDPDETWHNHGVLLKKKATL